jgi:hypothetical protein
MRSASTSLAVVMLVSVEKQNRVVHPAPFFVQVNTRIWYHPVTLSPCLERHLVLNITQSLKHSQDSVQLRECNLHRTRFQHADLLPLNNATS